MKTASGLCASGSWSALEGPFSEVEFQGHTELTIQADKRSLHADDSPTPYGQQAADPGTQSGCLKMYRKALKTYPCRWFQPSELFFFLLKKVKKRPSRENSGIILRKSPTVYIHVSPEE
jgi:hypothetical protein